MGKEKGPDSVMGRQGKVLERVMMSKHGLKGKEVSSGEHP